MSLKSTLISALALAGLAACGSDTTGPSLSVCGVVAPTTLAAGDVHLFDPASGPCVAVPSVPAAGGGGAEYLYLAVSGAGTQTSTGVTGPYAITGAALPGTTADQAPIPSPLLGAFKPALTAEQFHMMLRRKEREIASDPRTALFRPNVARAPSLAVTPPPVGDVKTFSVCQNTSCSGFVPVVAKAQVVGGNLAIYVDTNATTAQTYTPTDLQNISQLFDNYLYPIDTTNFGRESDIDNNGVVEVLLTPQINRLSGSCNTSMSVILGYFLSVDLEPSQQGSNKGEIFYSIVPDPTNSACTISKQFAEDNLGPTFIHEFQHMISYNRHVLLAGGTSEDTWLNEGTSHYAEELGGRLIPDAKNPLLPPCVIQPCENTLGQFAGGDYDNGYKYLTNPEVTALIESDQSTGTLNERGANWLMVKWLGNQFGTTTADSARFLVPSTDFTLKLENTTLLGAANVAQQSGQPFPDLVTYWQAANYLDDLPGFTPLNPRLQYVGFNLRAALAQLAKTPAFPLVPDSTKTGAYTHAGTLHQGSGHHVRIIQVAGASGVQFKLSGTAGAAISPTLAARVGLVRIR
ncbi:MAG TPA: hypothetical protein VK132_07610 [Gemmatimonadales bacterium]|nr:hypothetical protein [Gemmatimonadales bacterium]